MKNFRIGKWNINLKILTVAVSVTVCSVALFIGMGDLWQKEAAPVFDNVGVTTQIEPSTDIFSETENTGETDYIVSTVLTEKAEAAFLASEEENTDVKITDMEADGNTDGGELTTVTDDGSDDSVKTKSNESKNSKKKGNKNKKSEKNEEKSNADAIEAEENTEGSERIFLLSFDGNNVVNDAGNERDKALKKESGKSAAIEKESDKKEAEQKELVLTGLSQGDKKAKKSKELECKYNPDMDIKLSDEEYEILCRIVEAEAGDQDVYGRILVANVILNRTKFWEFPDTVKEVVFQVNSNGAVQFAPVADGSFYRVEISDLTKKAVNSALSGDDYSDGALYFFMRSATSSAKASWFDTLDFVLKYGCHEFFK